MNTATSLPTTSLPTTTLAPLMFIGHGAPTLALDESTVTRQLNAVGQQFSEVKAVLVLSAHWVSTSLQVTGISQPELIYDFNGFQPELYQVKYPAIGDNQLANDIASMLTQSGLSTQVNMTRGLDHGVWTPLMHLLPNPKVPVIQLSIPQHADLSFYLELGKAMTSLREQGIAVIGSGNVTHNLRALRFGGQPDPRVAEFEKWVRNNVINHNVQALVSAAEQYPNFSFFHPTVEHYIPLLFVLGAVTAQDNLTVIQNDIDFSVLSMESYLFNSQAK
ncbi:MULTISPECIES: DODA-type extradiol aromatic ring-opening family dioxygenase [Shewanella]|uniref:Dioxygenase n=1 Tax=Shewanella psychromarinicola TaxID=2487742 RepID=A0A3N4DFM6_9GAMM|nr:class III extradiol ring-cleavage dioxygenase [Shewanella psychromarinicola]AZG33563.1 dioxygenase [Shewanella psychromarinicola]MCL1082444.1 dioxygenase [Shewanella psychromarinicola]RPA23642.1 dioxygenase [Shewanella psychromarinicola]